MTWPTPQDYNEAVQNPRQNFSDVDLQTGELRVSKMGLPVVASGSFASVYGVKANGKQFAVRCFLKDIPDQHQRYERISNYVMSDDLPYTVDFNYITKGILVKGAWFPILKMDWVEGTTLDTYVKQNLITKAGVGDIAAKFKQMMTDLQKAGIAHGDLQHGNIMVTPERELRLVDYDGMFVPELKGLQSTELGHRNYQHPAREAHNFGAEIDNFSAWSIYVSLIALSIDPDLSRRLSGCDECLLFRQNDYRYPLSSAVFFELEHHTDQRISDLAKILRMLLSMSIDSVPPLSEETEVPQNLPTLRKVDPGTHAVIPLAPVAHVHPAKTEEQKEIEERYKWPSLSDYIRAVSEPRRNFIDPLMQNFVLALEHGNVHAEGSDHGAVFKFHQPDSDKQTMVKCFLKGDDLLQQRYQMLHTYLMGHAPDHELLNTIFIDFKFIPGGLKVGSKYVPIIRMPMLKYKTLFEAVEAGRHDPAKMNGLIQKFKALMNHLEANGIVHGDIEPDNILVAPHYMMVIDYDLTTTPTSRALASPLLGSKHYRHPKLKAGGPQVTDDFAAWIIYYSLQLLMLYPSLWNIAGAKPGRLLFHARDLADPRGSDLFEKLKSHYNEQVRATARKVQELCLLPPEAVPRFKPMSVPMAVFDKAIGGNKLAQTQRNSPLLAQKQLATRTALGLVLAALILIKFHLVPASLPLLFIALGIALWASGFRTHKP